jgi:hypothetical protein
MRIRALVTVALVLACAPPPPEFPPPEAPAPEAAAVPAFDPRAWDSLAVHLEEARERSARIDEQRVYITAALRRHYPDLLRGRTLLGNGRAVWFLADASGSVEATGIRAALPDTVAFDAVATLVPALGGRRYRSITLAGVSVWGPATDVTVLWVELAPAP